MHVMNVVQPVTLEDVLRLQKIGNSIVKTDKGMKEDDVIEDILVMTEDQIQDLFQEQDHIRMVLDEVEKVLAIGTIGMVLEGEDILAVIPEVDHGAGTGLAIGITDMVLEDGILEIEVILEVDHGAGTDLGIMIRIPDLDEMREIVRMKDIANIAMEVEETKEVK